MAAGLQWKGERGQTGCDIIGGLVTDPMMGLSSGCQQDTHQSFPSSSLHAEQFRDVGRFRCSRPLGSRLTEVQPMLIVPGVYVPLDGDPIVDFCCLLSAASSAVVYLPRSVLSHKTLYSLFARDTPVYPVIADGGLRTTPPVLPFCGGLN